MTQKHYTCPELESVDIAPEAGFTNSDIPGGSAGWFDENEWD